MEFAIENAQTLKKREIRRHSINAKDGQGPESRPSAAAAEPSAEEATQEEQAVSKRTQRKRKRQDAKHGAEVCASAPDFFCQTSTHASEIARRALGAKPNHAHSVFHNG